MRVLVTGATGKVGNAVARQLVDRGDEVVALVRDAARAREALPGGVELAVGDVTDPDSIRRAAAGADGVFNCMGLYEQWLPDPDTFERVNAEGSRDVVIAAREAGVGRLVHTSTFDVFHAVRGGTVSESALADYPKNTAYERSKQHAEELVLEAAEGIEVVICNPAGVYGPGPWAGAGIDSMIRDAIRRRLPAVPPGGMTLALCRRRRRRPPRGLRPRAAGRALHPRQRLRHDARDHRDRGRRRRSRLGAADDPGALARGLARGGEAVSR